MSNHLACLRGCGWSRPRGGRQVRYELADDRLADALRELAGAVLDSPACPAHRSPARDYHPAGPEPAVRAAPAPGRLLNRLTIG